jgi:hypothetical protein
VPYDVAPDEPKVAAAGIFYAPTRLAAADGVIDSGPSWGHSGPWVADVDGDGRRDLVVGDFSGLFRLLSPGASKRIFRDFDDEGPSEPTRLPLSTGSCGAKHPRP